MFLIILSCIYKKQFIQSSIKKKDSLMIRGVTEAFQEYILYSNQHLTSPFSNFSNTTKTDVVQMMSTIGSMHLEKVIKTQLQQKRQKITERQKDANNPLIQQGEQNIDISQFINKWNNEPKNGIFNLLNNSNLNCYSYVVDAFNNSGNNYKLMKFSNEVKRQNIQTYKQTTTDNIRRKSRSRSRSRSSSSSYENRDKRRDYKKSSSRIYEPERRYQRSEREKDYQRERNRGKDLSPQRDRSREGKYYPERERYEKNSGRQRYRNRQQVERGRESSVDRDRDRYYDYKSSKSNPKLPPNRTYYSKQSYGNQRRHYSRQNSYNRQSQSRNNYYRERKYD